MPPKDRKVVAVGLTRLLTQSSYMLREPSVQAWYAMFNPLFDQRSLQLYQLGLPPLLP